MSIVSELYRRFKIEQDKEYLGKEKVVNKNTPLVSVSVATYQHKNFIRQCLEGIVMQKTNFPIEVIVGDDGSTDGTTEICKQYAEKHPNVIRLFIRNRESSLYYENEKFICRYNGVWCRMSCRGKYIALCEGDDYWTDPLKLQKQVDIIEQSKGLLGGVGHQVNIVINDKIDRVWRDDIKEGVLPLHLFGNYRPFHTASFLFEKDILLPFSDMYISIISGDKLTYLIVSLQKPIYYINQSMAVYRKHAGGISTSFDYEKLFKNNLLMYEILRNAGFNIPHKVYYQFLYEEYINHLPRKKTGLIKHIFSSLQYAIKSNLTTRFLKDIIIFSKHRLFHN